MPIVRCSKSDKQGETKRGRYAQPRGCAFDSPHFSRVTGKQEVEAVTGRSRRLIVPFADDSPSVVSTAQMRIQRLRRRASLCPELDNEVTQRRHRTAQPTEDPTRTIILNGAKRSQGISAYAASGCRDARKSLLNQFLRTHTAERIA